MRSVPDAKGLWLASLLPVLVVELGKAYRRHMTEKRKAAERQQSAEIRVLQDRIAKLEASARWAR